MSRRASSIARSVSSLSVTSAARALSGLEGVEAYLRQQGESRIPAERRECADAVLRAFLSSVFAERSEFGFDRTRFEAAYDELERALYEGRAVTMNFILVNGPEGWLIYDVESPHDSLRAFLAQHRN